MDGYIINELENGEMEFTQYPFKLTLWEAIKSFFNSHFNENIKRKELLNYLKENFYNNRKRWGEYKSSFTTVDTYRNYLYKAGYLIKIKIGVYRLTREIPYGLTLKQVIYEAYHAKKEYKYNIYGEFVRTSETTAHLYRKAPIFKKKKEFIKEEDFKV